MTIRRKVISLEHLRLTEPGHIRPNSEGCIRILADARLEGRRRHLPSVPAHEKTAWIAGRAALPGPATG